LKLNKFVSPEYLFLMVIAVLAQGCAKEFQPTAELREDETALVRSTVADPGSVERLLEILAERDRLVTIAAKSILPYQQQMRALNADYHSNHASFNKKVDEFNRGRAQKQKQFIRLIVSMKRESSVAEWEIIARYQIGRLDLRKLIVQESHEEILGTYLLGGGILGGSFFTSADVDRIANQVALVVTEPARVQTASHTLAALKTANSKFDALYAGSSKQFNHLYRNHALDGSRMLALFGRLNTETQAIQQRIIDLRFLLKSSITAAEWASIFRAG